MTGTDIRKQVLSEVEKCVCSDRQSTYGDAEDNFSDIAALANIVLGPKLSHPLTPEDVAIFSMCIKMSRIKSTPSYEDSWIDMAGYAVCGCGIIRRKKSADSQGS